MLTIALFFIMSSSIQAGDSLPIEGEEPITIEYKNANMTIEFKENEIIIGKATLESHKTYDEILEVPSGENRTVIWYEFSGFESIKENAFIEEIGRAHV